MTHHRRPTPPMSTWMPAGEYVHLLYLFNLLWQPFFDESADWVDWLVVVGVVVLFVPIYVLAHHPDPRFKRIALAATIALGTVATMFNIGASVLFVYAIANVAWVDRRRVVWWQAGLTGLCGLLVLVSPVPWPFRLYGILPSVVFIWVIGWLVTADARRHDEAQRLRIDNVRIEQLATADERERIARDLHDLVGQSLTGLVVKAQLVQSLLPSDPDTATAQAADLETSARDALAQVRAAIDGLGQVSLVDEVDTAARTLGAAGVDLSADVTAAGQPGPLVERILALALREATTNVVRHARASRCTVTLDRVTDQWVLVVVDDGVGGGTEEGNGLRGMRERVLAVGGVVHRDVTNGTRLTVEVPA
ncbi:sensor histidine kinase [Salsipaludibacter albus]|uniref:sensor histidine kinase n=1 Tax=Salsipaludibacter albus TaxID=2849650 RepID=UPI001EE429BA|nr:histidine kinase [Salsipaludibacter albus]MBY5163692.1 sensor histidine kinase [Salsipaludibacter albus]